MMPKFHLMHLEEFMKIMKKKEGAILALIRKRASDSFLNILKN